MNIIIAWLLTSTEFLLIDTVNILRLFKDIADNGLKINPEKLSQFSNRLIGSRSLDIYEKNNGFPKYWDNDTKIFLLSFFVPFYNFCQTYLDIKMYNQLHQEVIKELYMFGLLEKMSAFEFREYQKNPSVVNAILVPFVCKARLFNAYTLELDDPKCPGKIVFELTTENGQRKIEILEATGLVASLSPEEQQAKIELFMITYALEHEISLKNSPQNLSYDDEKKIWETYKETLSTETSKQKTLTRKKK